MKLNAPTKPVFLIAVILGLLALVSTSVAIPIISANAFWMLALAFILLALGNVLKGM